MNVVVRPKRRASPPTPSPPPPVKRVKADDDAKLDRYTPPPLPLTTPRGVERIPFSPSLNPNRLSSQHLSQLTSERATFLRGQGRHVVGLPLVLNDGIVLNWVRDTVGGRSHTTKDNHPVVPQSAAQKEGLRLPDVSTWTGSGASASDAIVVSDDEEISRVPGTSAANAIVDPYVGDVTDSQSESLINRDAPLSKDVIDAPCSDTESFSADSSDPSRAFTTDEDTVTLSGHRSDDTDATTSDSEADGVDEGVDCSRITPSPRAKPPSLKPIRKLLARGKWGCDPERAPPQRTIVSPTASRKQGGEEFLEESLAITSNEGGEELVCPASNPQLRRVPLPQTNHGRARRLLLPESAELPLVAITMRGDCHFIERKKKYRISGHSLPNPGVFRHVGDVCMVGNTAVLGCDKGTHQIAFLSVMGRPRMIDVTWTPHSSGLRYQATEKRGVSRLAAIHAEDGHIKFLSGGYDGTIHKWTAGIERLSEPRSRQKRLHVTDLNRCKTMTHPVSNDIQQIHIHPQAAYLTLLEVRHLDQIQLYDSRKGDFDGEPCLSFGRRNASGKFSGMHTRGSVHLVHFATASEDRGVLLWDFRNSKRAVIERRFQQAERVVHTIFADGDIATFGQGVVTFFEDYL